MGRGAVSGVRAVASGAVGRARAVAAGVGSRARAVVVGVVAVGLAGAALRVAMSAFDWGAFRAQVHGLAWRWLLAAVAFDVASYVMQGVRWRSMLGGSSVWMTTRAIYAGLFLNELVPMRPGEAVRAWLVSRELGRGLLDVAPSVVAERMLDGLWLGAGALVLLRVAPLPEAVARGAWLLVALMGVLGVAAVALGRTRAGVFRGVRLGVLNPWAVAMSGTFLAAQTIAIWSVGRAAHLGLGVLAAAVVMVMVRIGTMIPLAPANLGTHQLSTVLALGLYGVGRAEAVGFALVLFVVLTLPLLTLGLGACLYSGVAWEDVRRAREGGACYGGTNHENRGDTRTALAWGGGADCGRFAERDSAA